jgi:hypothetical protein
MRTKAYINMLVDKNINRDDLERYESSLWSFIPRIQALRRIRLNVNHRKKARGIVMTCGKGNFEYALQFIATTRTVLKSTMPIEVFYYGAQDLTHDMVEHLENSFVNVNAIDLSQRQNAFNQSIIGVEGAGWAMKPFALLSSSFDEVMLVDADTVLLIKPEAFFSTQGYRETGTLFFKDRLAQCTGKNGPKQEMHLFLEDQFGQDGPPGRIAKEQFWVENCHHYQESGLLLSDLTKPSVFASLLLTAWMNTAHVRDVHTYQRFHGDKESFWLAFALSQQPYHFNQRYGGTIGSEFSPHADGFCSDHLLHLIDDTGDSAGPFLRWQRGGQSAGQTPSDDNDPEITPHVGRPAWINGSLRRNKLRSSKEFLIPQDTIWATEGWWEWDYDAQTFCLRDYVRQTLSDRDLRTLKDLVQEARRVEAQAIEADLIDGLEAARQGDA